MVLAHSLYNHIAMVSLPTGTVTFLFTDIEGSTPLWEQHREAMAAALEVHNSTLRLAIAAHGGMVFKIVGDAFQAVFPTALQALQAAITAQRSLQSAAWNELGPLQVRMGLHTGEAALDPGGDEYAVSHTKNRAARVMSAGHGGQILLSQETAVLVERETREGVRLKDLGEHRLKGLSYPERLFQVIAPGLREDFPPLVSSVETPHNLPSQLTSFIGRESLIEQASQSSLENRLVSLTGTGGVGKTRLALQVAERALPHFADGVWWAALAPVSNPERIPQVIAEALGLRLTEGDALQSLVERLRTMCLLLVLDNCEHLVEGCAQVAAALLRECPKIHLLATSREALNVPGERVVRVPALAVPTASESSGGEFQRLEELAQYEAAQLLIARAREASPGRELADADAASLARICRRLDGIPLGLELAAARLRILSPEQVAERLDDRFRLLTGGSRTALPHHQTLRAAIDWSYQLLDEREKLLFQRLSVFSGGWTLEAAEGICAGEFSPHVSSKVEPSLALDHYEVLDLLAGLVDKSLVQVEQAPGKPTRYTLLETLRQYGREKLLESGEAVALYRQHRAWMVEWVEAGLPNQKNDQLVRWMDALEEDFDDLRAALEWGYMENIGPETALRLASALYRYWWMRGDYGEAYQWLQKGLGAPSPSPAELVALHPETALQRARALYCLAWVYGQTERSDHLIEILDKSISLYENLGPLGETGLVEALAWKAASGPLHPDLENEAPGLLAQAINLGRKLGHSGRWELAMALWTEASRQLEMGQLEAAETTAQESWALFLQVGDRWNAGPLNILGQVEMQRGDYAAARKYFEQALACYRESRDKGGIGSCYLNLTGLMLAQRSLPEAAVYFRESAKIWQAQGNRQFVATYFKNMVFINLQAGFADPQADLRQEVLRLASVWSFAEKYDPELTAPPSIDSFLTWWDQFARQSQNVDFLQVSDETRQANFQRLNDVLEEIGPAAFAQAAAEGESLSFHQALARIPEIPALGIAESSPSE
jgi:predicted ATPase/class 3 adenylate cyclase